VDEHTALITVCGLGVAGVVALHLCGAGDAALGMLAFCSGIALYIIGKEKKA